jgi:hypothetical protein
MPSHQPEGGSKAAATVSRVAALRRSPRCSWVGPTPAASLSQVSSKRVPRAAASCCGRAPAHCAFARVNRPRATRSSVSWGLTWPGLADSPPHASRDRAEWPSRGRRQALANLPPSTAFIHEPAAWPGSRKAIMAPSRGPSKNPVCRGRRWGPRFAPFGGSNGLVCLEPERDSCETSRGVASAAATTARQAATSSG